jgi:hypothetical protein
MPLMRAQMQREFELAHSRYEERIRLLRGTIMGFATNATQCKACMMGNECATETLARDDVIAANQR